MWWRIILVVIAYLVLGAHFLRFGGTTWAILISTAPLLLLTRRSLAVTILQGGLILGTFLIWVPTTYNLINMRIMFEQPWVRMSCILSAVMLCNLLIAYLADQLKKEFIK